MRVIRLPEEEPDPEEFLILANTISEYLVKMKF
jgi:hypothetical protein